MFLAACASNAPLCLTVPREEMPSPPPEPISALGPGDEIRVKFRYWPDLNETQRIRPDGKITLLMVDDVQAAGLTPMELDANLTKLYADHIRDPNISVIAVNFVKMAVYVGGDVREPDYVNLIPGMTVLQAIHSVGGFMKKTAQYDNVIVVRLANGKQYATSVDIKRALSVYETDPFYLAPGDVVFVPRTKIDAVNQWIEQNIENIVPEGLYYSSPKTPWGWSQ